MTLNEWAEAHEFSDREIAEKMTEWLRIEDPEASPVSFQAVQKYRTGRVPPKDRMQSIYHISEGWVTANDFFALPVAAQ